MVHLTYTFLSSKMEKQVCYTSCSPLIIVKKNYKIWGKSLSQITLNSAETQFSLFFFFFLITSREFLGKKLKFLRNYQGTEGIKTVMEIPFPAQEEAVCLY